MFSKNCVFILMKTDKKIFRVHARFHIVHSLYMKTQKSAQALVFAEFFLIVFKNVFGRLYGSDAFSKSLAFK